MSEGHQLLGAPHIMRGKPDAKSHAGIRRLNRLPVFVMIGIILVVIATVVFGLSSRGLWRSGSQGERGDDGGSASSFAENLKRGVKDSIIEENPPAELRPPPVETPAVIAAPPRVDPTVAPQPTSNPTRLPENDNDLWRERLAREHEEQILNERHRQAMARLQRADGARAAPLRIDTDHVAAISPDAAAVGGADRADNKLAGDALSARLIAQAVSAGVTGLAIDPNGQGQKQAFLDTGRRQLTAGMRMAEPAQPRTLSRGSIIPAMLLTGINADLPGRILAQVSQNIYDSATGRHLLIPQGTRLVGRYDSKVSHGQSRILVVWTDIVLANGQSLDIGSMTGIDQEGQAGFKDRIDRHYLRTFGSAALVALIGTGMDLALPDDRNLGLTDASDAARRSFTETFGRLAEKSISKNLDVQPTLSIRPGYRFNVLVDQDLAFG